MAVPLRVRTPSIMQPTSPQLRVLHADPADSPADPEPEASGEPSPASPASPAVAISPPSPAASSLPVLPAIAAAPQIDEPRGALAAEPPLEPTEAVLAELAEASVRLESASPEEILRWSVERFAPRFTMATAFGPEGMCLIHMLAEVAPETPIFNLETGYQFKETLELRETVRRRYGIEVEFKYPELTVEQYEAANGGPVYKTDPNRCCGNRKLEVLHRAARGQYAWASAIRRDQSPDRAKAPIVGWDKKFQLVKVSPLANWTKQQVWGLINDQKIPYNPLHDRGYPSVGCWPCTRSVMEGEDERAGRWSGFEKTECGLHSS